MAEEILSEHAERIETITIVPSSGGRFVVTAGARQVFSKKEVGRFPNKGEIAELLSGAL